LTHIWGKKMTVKHYEAIVLVPKVVHFRSDAVAANLTHAAHLVAGSLESAAGYTPRLLQIEERDPNLPLDPIPPCRTAA